MRSKSAPFLRILLLVLGGLALPPSATRLQGQAAGDAAVTAYYRGVADYFRLPSNEIMILSEWRLPADEIPVVLFVADRGGIPPEAVVALRHAGRGWSDVARRYSLDAASFHVAMDGSAGSLARAYEAYGSRPQAEWPAIVLQDGDIVSLVNLRVLAAVLHVTPASLVQARDRDGSWVAAYQTLARR